VVSERKGLAVADVEIAEVYEQVIERIEIENALNGTVGSTARRIVVTIFEILRARRRNALPPYPERVVQGVVWLLVRSH
jgi:hypothetical protein